MLFYYTLFLFIAFGSKLLLALLMIYMLLPTQTSCNSCDEETLLIQPSGAGRFFNRLSGGRVQRRWCPRCEWFGFSRPIASASRPRTTGGRLRKPSPRDRPEINEIDA
ncbi:hypothetical protein BH23GEM6_BH23GEM6_08180 [soil metagenome]